MKFIMLINVKMSTIVGILTFISKIVGILTFMSMINSISESLNARKVFIIHHFSFYEQLEFHALFSLA